MSPAGVALTNHRTDRSADEVGFRRRRLVTQHLREFGRSAT